MNGCQLFSDLLRIAAVLVRGQYRDPVDKVYFLSLDESKGTKSEKCQLLLPNGKIPKDGTLIGRGSTLHLFTKREWYKVDLENV